MQAGGLGTRLRSSRRWLDPAVLTHPLANGQDRGLKVHGVGGEEVMIGVWVHEKGHPFASDIDGEYVTMLQGEGRKERGGGREGKGREERGKGRGEGRGEGKREGERRGRRGGGGEGEGMEGGGKRKKRMTYEGDHLQAVIYFTIEVMATQIH